MARTSDSSPTSPKLAQSTEVHILEMQRQFLPMIPYMLLSMHHLRLGGPVSTSIWRCLTSHFLERPVLKADALTTVQCSNQVPAVETLGCDNSLSTNEPFWCSFISLNHHSVTHNKRELYSLYFCSICNNLFRQTYILLQNTQMLILIQVSRSQDVLCVWVRVKPQQLNWLQHSKHNSKHRADTIANQQRLQSCRIQAPHRINPSN